MNRVSGYNPRMWAVVDLDTGTVVGTNVRLVATYPGDPDLEGSDKEIIRYATEHGVELEVED